MVSLPDFADLGMIYPFAPCLVISVYLSYRFTGGVHHRKTSVYPFKYTAVQVKNIREAFFLKNFTHFFASVSDGAIHDNFRISRQSVNNFPVWRCVSNELCAGDMAYFILGTFPRIKDKEILTIGM